MAKEAEADAKIDAENHVRTAGIRKEVSPTYSEVPFGKQ
jgi:hypothetical protein